MYVEKEREIRQCVCVCVWQPILFDVVAYFLLWMMILILIMIFHTSLFCGGGERWRETMRERESFLFVL